MEQGTIRLKTGLAEMLKGGVIMDVTTPEQAKIAEEAGACAVMALERVPADIRAAGGIARMADPTIVKRIMEVVSIPVMAKARIGHFVEARILEALGVDYIDESEVLTPADDRYHIDKRDFTVPFVCGCRNLGEALAAEIFANNLKLIYPYPELVKIVPTTTLVELRRTKAPAVLVEVAYHDNVDDANWITSNIEPIAENLSLSLADVLGVPFVEI